jgi:hypothetical protein
MLMIMTMIISGYDHGYDHGNVIMILPIMTMCADHFFMTMILLRPGQPQLFRTKPRCARRRLGAGTAIAWVTEGPIAATQHTQGTPDSGRCWSVPV